MTLKISISGVRGFVPESLTPEVCLHFAKAFGTYLNGGKVVVGTDPRASSEFIKGIIFSGLLSTGCKVVDLGIVPTPTVGIMARKLKADGGIVITASHNPLPWNGLKFMRGDGVFLNETQAGQFIKIYEGKQFRTGLARGVSSDRTGIATHIARVLKVVNAPLICRRKFKVAVDACNGAGAVAMIELLKKLGCLVTAINTNLNLPFAHNPEPTAENLTELRALVRSRQADIGFAMDSDADRLAVIDEAGEALGEEATLALAVKFILGRSRLVPAKKRLVVVNLSTSQMIDDVCREFGALCLRTRVGEVNVVEEIKSVNALIGGEGNGGVIYPKVGLNRDSLTGAALLLNALAVKGRTVSSLVEEIPHYFMIKTKVECADLDAASDLIEKAKHAFPDEDLVLTEGVKVIRPEGWVHVRASNTEPIVRFIAEARTKEEAEDLIRRVLA